MTINQGLRGAAQARRLHPTPELEGQLHHVRVDFGFVELAWKSIPDCRGDSDQMSVRSGNLRSSCSMLC